MKDKKPFEDEEDSEILSDKEVDPYLSELERQVEDIKEDEPTGADVAPHPEEEEVSEEPLKKPAKEEPERVFEEMPPLAKNIPVEVQVVVGAKRATLANLLAMKKGEILELDKGLSSSCELMVQDKVIARGELVEIDGRLGVRLLQVL